MRGRGDQRGKVAAAPGDDHCGALLGVKSLGSPSGPLIGCSSTPDATDGIDLGSKTSLETLATAYNLDSGDRFRITVFRQVDLSGEFVLDGHGNLALPLIGEVNQPSSYPHVSGMTGTTAVAMAGGFTYRARQSSMMVQRRGRDERQSMGLASTVLPGDILNIGERFF